MINPTGIINQYNERILVSGLSCFVPCCLAEVYFVTLCSPGKDLNLWINCIHGGAKINWERNCWEDTNAAEEELYIRRFPSAGNEFGWLPIMDCSREQLVNQRAELNCSRATTTQYPRRYIYTICVEHWNADGDTGKPSKGNIFKWYFKFSVSI